MFLLQVEFLIPRVKIYLEILVTIVITVFKIIFLFLPMFVGFYMGFNLLFGKVSKNLDFSPFLRSFAIFFQIVAYFYNFATNNYF